MSGEGTLDLSGGPVRYRDRGDGEPLVFVNGLLVDSRIWDRLADSLGDGCRCIQPDWPMGSHTIAMNEDADLTPAGHADRIAEAIRALGLERATIVGNDSGGAISQILAARHPEVVERLVLTNCDMYDKFPPFPFSLMGPVAKVPGGMSILQAPFRVGAIGRFTYGMLARKPIDRDLVASWLEPARRDPAIARDTRKLLVSAHKSQTLEAAEMLRGFEAPVLFAWGVEDRFFPLDYAKRLASTMADARVVEIPDAKTFVSLDQPAALAEAITAFVREPADTTS